MKWWNGKSATGPASTTAARWAATPACVGGGKRERKNSEPLAHYQTRQRALAHRAYRTGLAAGPLATRVQADQEMAVDPGQPQSHQSGQEESRRRDRSANGGGPVALAHRHLPSDRDVGFLPGRFGGF